MRPTTGTEQSLTSLESPWNSPGLNSILNCRRAPQKFFFIHHSFCQSWEISYFFPEAWHDEKASKWLFNSAEHLTVIPFRFEEWRQKTKFTRPWLNGESAQPIPTRKKGSIRSRRQNSCCAASFRRIGGNSLSVKQSSRQSRLEVWTSSKVLKRARLCRPIPKGIRRDAVRSEKSPNSNFPCGRVTKYF